MTKNVFLKCCDSMSNRETTFTGGKVEMNGGMCYKHVVKLEFDLAKDCVRIFFLDINSRKRVQQYLQSWLASGKTIFNFQYPTITVSLDRQHIKHIDFPYKKVVQLLLPFYD